MRHHRELFDRVKKCTGMFLAEETYREAAAFVLGYDLACEGGVLLGFREWLVLRLGRGENLAWYALVLDAAFPGARSPEERLPGSPQAQRHAIDTLFDLITEFDGVRAKHDGLGKIFADYERRARRKAVKP